MTDEEIEKLERLLAMLPGLVHWRDPYDGAYFRIHSVKHDHRETDDPQETPESIALIKGSTNHVGLFGASASEFVLLKTDITQINWG